MRRINLGLSVISGIIAASLGGAFGPAVPSIFVNNDDRYRDVPQTGKKIRKTGELYPHSSTRQRARYARQIAAGQIRETV